MWGYGYNMMGWGWLIGAVLVAVVVIVMVILALRFVPGRSNSATTSLPSAAGTAQTPRQILDERYATGDLATDEYLERVKHLGSD